MQFIDFKEKTYGEGRFARLAAEAIGSDHQEIVLSVEDCLKVVPKLGAHMDEPLADASLLPTFLLQGQTNEYNSLPNHQRNPGIQVQSLSAVLQSQLFRSSRKQSIALIPQKPLQQLPFQACS